MCGVGCLIDGVYVTCVVLYLVWNGFNSKIWCDIPNRDKYEILLYQLRTEMFAYILLNIDIDINAY